MNQRERLKFFAEASRYLDREALNKVGASLFVGDNDVDAKDYGTAKSGNWGHKGRPGYHGGSAKGSGGKEMRKDIQVKYEGAKRTKDFRSAYKKAQSVKSVSEWHSSLSDEQRIAVKDQHANICKQTGSKESYEHYTERLFKMMTAQFTPPVTIPNPPPPQENPIVQEAQSTKGENEPKIVPAQGQTNTQPQPQNAKQASENPHATENEEQANEQVPIGAYSDKKKQSKLHFLMVGGHSTMLEKMINEMSPTDRIACQYTWKGDSHFIVLKNENGKVYMKSGLAVDKADMTWNEGKAEAASSILSVIENTLSASDAGEVEYVDYIQNVENDDDVNSFFPKAKSSQEEPQQTKEQNKQESEQPKNEENEQPKSEQPAQETPKAQEQPIVPVWQQYGMTKSYYEGKMASKMMGYIKSGSTSMISNILENYTDEGDTIGFTYKIFEKGQVVSKVSETITKNADGTFSVQLKSNGTTVDLPIFTAQQMTHHLAASNDYENGAGASSMIVKKAMPKQNKPKQTPTQKPVHAVKQGTDISSTYKPDKNAKSKINDIIHQQGFDGVPKVVQDDEFDKIVKNGTMPLMLRTYSGISQQQADDFDKMLEQGEWYVECSTGGAYEGQGMYTVASYNSSSKHEQHELKMQMGRYQRYSRQKAMGLAEVPQGLHRIKDVHTGEITMIEQNPTTFGKDKPKDGEIVYLHNYSSTTYQDIDGNHVKLDASYRGYFYSKGKLYIINDQDIEFDPQHEHYDEGPKITKTMSYYREADKEQYNLPQRFPVIRAMTLDPSAKILTSAEAKKLCTKYNNANKYKTGFEPITDHGQIAAIYGYDAISAHDTGNSSAGGDYLIVVNRTKVILKKSRVVKRQMYKP